MLLRFLQQSGEVLDGTDHLRNVGVLVVVPGNNLNLSHTAGQLVDHGLSSIEQRTVGHTHDIGGNDLVLVVAVGHRNGTNYLFRNLHKIIFLIPLPVSLRKFVFQWKSTHFTKSKIPQVEKTRRILDRIKEEKRSIIRVKNKGGLLSAFLLLHKPFR